MIVSERITVQFFINNRLSGEVDLDPADVARDYIAAATSEARFIERSAAWPTDRALRDWLTDSDHGLGATWTDEAGYAAILARVAEELGKLPPVRTARVAVRARSGDGSLTPTREEVARYMPANYAVSESGDAAVWVYIVGRDYCGWTMEDYILPRLGSGLIYAEEVTS